MKLHNRYTLSFVLSFAFYMFYRDFFNYYAGGILEWAKLYIYSEYDSMAFSTILMKRMYILYFVGCASGCCVTSALHHLNQHLKKDDEEMMEEKRMP